MKILLFAILFYQPVQAYGTDLQAIIKAIGGGNAAALGNYFDEEVAVTLMDKEGFYSKAAAVKAVSGFFASHPPKSFVQVHEGASKEGNARYFIGDLTTTAGNFRVYIYMKVSDGQTLIQELRFDP